MEYYSYHQFNLKLNNTSQQREYRRKINDAIRIKDEKIKKTQTINFSDHHERIKRLRRECKSAGVYFRDEEGNEQTLISYDIVHDVARIQQLREELNDQSIIDAYIDGEVSNNLITNILERHGGGKSEYLLIYKDDGRLYGHKDPHPFIEVLKRGLKSTEMKGSKAKKREDGEVKGGEWEEEYFRKADTHLGKMTITFSPPFEQYHDNVIIIKQKRKDMVTGKIYLYSVRYNFPGLTTEAYKQIAKKCKPDYFEKFEEINKGRLLENRMKLEEYYVGEPIPLGEKFGNNPDNVILNLVGSIDWKKQNKLQNVIEKTRDFINVYIHLLKTFSFKEPKEWVLLAKTYQAIMAFSDSFYKGKELITEITGKIKAFGEKILAKTGRMIAPIMYQINHWATQKIETVKAGCALNMGLTISEANGTNSTSSIFKKIFSKLGGIAGNFFKNDLENGNLINSLPCSKISCSKCKVWEASDEEAAKVIAGELTVCPNCHQPPG